MPKESNAAGTMWSSVADYTAFIHHLIFDEDPEIKQIFELMVTPQVQVHKWNTSWGLGIGLQENNGQKAMWHWGDDKGFKAFTISYFGDQSDLPSGITIFTNGDNGFKVYTEILERILPHLPEYIKSKLK